MANSSATKERTIVTLVPADKERERLKSPHVNFYPYPLCTSAVPWVNLVATHGTMRMSTL